MRRFQVSAIVITLLSVSVLTEAADRYWVSFNTGFPHGLILMKIDSGGNVLRAPEPILPAIAVFTGTALTPTGPRRLSLWFLAAGGSADHQIWRAILRRSDLTGPSARQLPVTPQGLLTLSTSQHARTRLLVAETPLGEATAYGLKVRGALDGRSFDVSPASSDSLVRAGISADGRISWSVTNGGGGDRLLTQFFTRGVRPRGTPRLVGATDIGSEMVGVDVSNPLAGSRKRVAVYQEWAAGSSRIYSQLLGAGGAPIGPRHEIADSQDSQEPSQALAVDPTGRFLIYTAKTTCDAGGGPLPVYQIYLQSLKADGSAGGNRVELTNCSFGFLALGGSAPTAFDILRE